MTAHPASVQAVNAFREYTQTEHRGGRAYWVNARLTCGLRFGYHLTAEDIEHAATLCRQWPHVVIRRLLP